MIESKNLRVILTPRAESIFSDILKNNNIEENSEDSFDDLDEEKETKESIIKNTSVAIAKKATPDEKLVELLQKHLEISDASAKKIISDIKEKLLPLLVIAPDEKFNDPIFREKISEKVFGDETPNESHQNNNPLAKALPEEEKKEAFRRAKEELLRKIAPVVEQNSLQGKEAPEIAMPYKKEPSITDVEDNAKSMEETKKPMVSQNKEPEKPNPMAESKPDPYKESVE